MSGPTMPLGGQPPVEPGPAHAQTASLGEELGHTRQSLSGLARAHVDLFKTEIGAILDQVKQMAALGGGILAIGLLLANMLYVGGFLFLGEWLFGSIGWGLAHGLLFGIGLIVALVLGILGARASSSVISFVIAALIAIAIALLCASNVGYDLAARAAGNLAQPFGSPGVVALIAGALVGTILFALMLARVGGGKGFIGGLVLGLIVGALIGWIVAGAPWTAPPAVGFAITIGLIFWPILNFIIAWPGIDLEQRFGNLAPRQSIEAVNETRSWLEEQWQTRKPTRGTK